MTEQINKLTVNIGDPAGARQLSADEANQVIRAQINAGNYQLAAFIAQQITALIPEDCWPYLRLAEAYLMNQQNALALQSVDQALQINPKNVPGLIIKSRLHLGAGDSDMAVQLMEQSVSLSPKNTHVLFEQGELLTEVGDMEGARISYLRAIDLDGRNTSSLLGLSRLPGDNFSDELIKKVEFIVHSQQLPAEEQIKAHFALAHAYDKKSAVARHFAHLTAGNKLKSRMVNFDLAAPSRDVAQTIEVFSESLFAERRSDAGNPAKILFIVGFPRCGSTLVEQILSSHPEVSAGGELFALNQSIQKYQNTHNLSAHYPFFVNEQSTAALGAIADEYIGLVKKYHLTGFMTDKQLPNYMFVGLIHLIFPNAKIINVQRNPIDICYSCYKRLFKLNSLPYMYDLDHLAGMYRNYQKLIRHWNQVLPGKIHTLHYERLIDHQEEVTRALLEHCELPWNDACMKFHENKRAVQTHSSTQVRQKLYSDSVDRWKVYAEYLGPLLELTNA